MFGESVVSFGDEPRNNTSKKAYKNIEYSESKKSYNDPSLNWGGGVASAIVFLRRFLTRFPPGLFSFRRFQRIAKLNRCAAARCAHRIYVCAYTVHDKYTYIIGRYSACYAN